MSQETWRLCVAVAGIALLLFLVIRVKWHAFVALLVASFFVGLAAGVDGLAVLDSVKKGMAETLGVIAVVVGLGAMLGQMLEVSGGAQRLAQTMMNTFGEKRATWALAFTGFIVCIPVFFDVALVILIPIIYGLSKKSGKSLLFFGVPLMAGMAVTHAFIPPTPGPMAVAQIINADMGWVILFGAIAGLPAAIIAGPVWGSIISRRINAEIPSYMAAPAPAPETEKELPSFTLVAFLVVFPLALILGNTVAAATLSEGDMLRKVLMFAGHPIVALLISTLLAFFLLGNLRGYTNDDIQSIANKALEPAGIIILITGAGGVFKQVLIDSGIGAYLGKMMEGASFPPVMLAFLIAVFIRIAQGSATVAMITAAGIMAPLLKQSNMQKPALALVVIAIAAGSTIMSHVNDSGFWLVNRFFGMTVNDTLKSWSVMTTIISLVGFLVVFALSFMF